MRNATHREIKAKWLLKATVGLLIMLIWTTVAVAQVAPDPAPSVAVTSTLAGETATYSVGFNITVAEAVYLTALEITFPDGAVLPAEVNASLEAANLGPATVSGRTASWSLNDLKAAAGAANITIPGIRHPATAGNYKLGLRFSWKYNPEDAETQVSTMDSGNYTLVSKVSNLLLSLSPAVTGSPAAYEFSLNVSANGGLAVGENIFIEFPTGTEFPAQVNGSQVKIFNQALAGNLSVSGRTLTIPTTGVTVVNNSTVTITILSGAGIKLPPTPGSHTWSVSTTKDASAASISRPITGGTVANVTLSVSPNRVNTAAEYVFQATTTANSALAAASDNIEITLPAGSSVPTGSLNPSHFRVNATPVTVTPVYDAVTRKLVLKTPVNVNASTPFTVTITAAANIKTPASAGTHTWQINTSKDTLPAAVSHQVISNAITKPNVALGNIALGAVSQYNINFNVSSTGALTAAVDTITVTFPSNTTVPGSISATNITVNGIRIPSSVSPGGRTVTFTVPQNIGTNGSVSIVFNSSANIKNPTSAGDYTLTVATSKDTTTVTSNEYRVGTRLTNVTASVTPNTVNSAGKYTVGFRVSGSGALSAGNDRITISFPSGTTMPSSIATGQITVNGRALNTGSLSFSSRTISFYVPSNVTNNSNVTVVIEADANIRNPQTPGNYRLSVYTSKDPTAVESDQYQIRGSVTSPTVVVTPPDSGTQAEYLITFRTSDIGALSGATDNISVIFPSGTLLPGAIPLSQIKVNNVEVNRNTVTVDTTNRKITFTVPSSLSITADRQVTVAIASGANIVNPHQAGQYRLQVATSKDTVAVESSEYAIRGTISAPAVTVAPSVAGQAGQYTITFKTSATGNLNSGTDTIAVQFPNNTTVPGTIPGKSITINGTAMSSSGITVSGPTVHLTVPNTVSIGANQVVTVIFKPEAGIKNPPGGSYTLSVWTSRNAKPIISNTYLTTVPVMHQVMLSIGSTQASKNTQNLTIDAPPFVIRGTTMVPIRFIAQSLEAVVDYNNTTKLVTVTLDGKIIRIQLVPQNKELLANRATVDGREYRMPVPAQVVNGRLFVPIRFISENLGADVHYEAASKTITITR